MTPEVTFLPDHKKTSVRPGTTLLDAGRRARVNIRTRCGGRAACLMCKLIVEDQSGLSPVSGNERLKLGDLVQRSYRLACQARVTNHVTATIPEDPLKAAVRAQLALQQQEDQGI